MCNDNFSLTVQGHWIPLDQNRAMVSFHHRCLNDDSHFNTAPAFEDIDPRKSEVQEETRDHATRRSKQRRDTRES